MSVYREKEPQRERKQRDSSASRRPKRTDSNDGRPIITQEKPTKPPKKSLKEKGKSQMENIGVDKPRKIKSDTHDDPKKEKKSLEKDRKMSKQDVVVKMKRHESTELRTGRVSNKIIAMKDLIEKRAIQKSEFGKNVKEKTEKPVKGVYQVEKTKEREEMKPKSRRDRTRTRTLSPTEVKQLLPAKMQIDMAGSGDRKIDVVGREEYESREVMETGGEDEEYEDDFENYDSDFESESPEESPTNATFVVLPATINENESPKPPATEDHWKVTVRKKEIEAVRKSIDRENYEVLERRKSIVKAYEDDSDKENIFVRPTSGLVDFSLASRKQKKSRRAAERRRRGEELLNMITLDAVSYSVLEIPPIAYDDFMKAFGKSNTKQVYVQTNEDDLDEEVQTDEITLINKWTQNPPEYLGSRKTENEVSYILTKEERLGVGGDVPLDEEMTVQPNTNALWNFLSWASQAVLIALEKKSGNFLSLNSMPNHSKAMAFGDGFVNLNMGDIPFLQGRAVTHLCFLSANAGRLLSVHTNREKSFQKCMICIWSLRELSKPLKVLMASNRVSSCCFGLNQGNLVFAGLTDGSICLWDLREPSAFHNRMTNSPEWSLQPPTYTTAGNMRDGGHFSPVVAVRLLSKTEAASSFGNFTPMQICSLDKDGTIVIWTVVQLEKTQSSILSDDLGLAHWGRVKLVKSRSFSVFASLRDEIPGFYITCHDILINEAEDDGFYVANSFGSVHHCSAYGTAMKPKFYVPSKQDAIVETTCLELCPFDANYFLVGCGDGTIRLHSRHQENPLICLNSNVAENDKETAAVVSLSWMHVRPCVFFALDSMSRINIWDLGVSDMYPEISLALTQKRITCMKLLPVSDPRQISFIVIGTEGGNIEIHKLKKEYGCRTVTDVKNEMKMFLKYVSIL